MYFFADVGYIGIVRLNSAMLLEVLLIVVTLLLFVYKKTCTIPPGLPPGSFGLPIFGDLPPKSQSLRKHFGKLRQKYGKIFTTKWGSHPLVVISDLSLLKKAFNHPDLQGRKLFHSLQIMNKNGEAGVVFSSGSQYALCRRWVMRVFRDLGMGKSALAASIQDEAAVLVKHLERQNLDKPVSVDWCINVAVFNVIWEMLAGLRFEADDDKIFKVMKMLDEDFSNLQGPMVLLDIFPWLIPFVPQVVHDKVLKGNNYEQNQHFFSSFAKDIIAEHAKKLDLANPRDMIDFYLLEIENDKDNPSTIFKSDCSDLVILMHDMVATGLETTSYSMRWVLLYMVAYPKVQEKVQAELDREVPRDRQPSLDDRPRMPYVEATILDVLRLSSFAPYGLQHEATADVQLEEYTIPKGTMLLATLEYFHHDPALWEKPNELYPEHFLDSEGNLDSKKEPFVPFSVGRRQCPGESLARMELFLFTTAILQRFEITAPPGVELNLEADAIKIVTNAPKPFKVMLKQRFT